MKILLKAPLSPFSGYGNDGIGIIKALVRKGHDVYLQPTHVDPPLPEYVVRLLTKPLNAPFDLAIVHTDPISLYCSPELRKACNFVVGWTMWEMSDFGNMDKLYRKDLRPNLSEFDAIAGYDDNTRNCLEEYTDTPLIVQQGGYWPDEWKYTDRDWFSDRFSFIMHGQLHERKNPFVAVEAYDELKREHPEFESAELHLHTTVLGLHPLMEQRYHHLKIYYETWPKKTLDAFYASAHCLLAPSRGEGKNLPALEFMTTGGAVIATNWGGHTQWLSPEYAYPLNYSLVHMDKNKEGMANTQWAAADKDHLKELMWHVFTHRGEVKEKAELAARTIPAMCSWDTVVDKLLDKIGTVSDRGSLARDKYLMNETLTVGPVVPR